MEIMRQLYNHIEKIANEVISVFFFFKVKAESDTGRGKGKLGRSERVAWTYIHYQM